MYAFDFFHRESLEIVEETGAIQLFGEDVDLVKSAYLSTDSACDFPAYRLQKQKSNSTKQPGDERNFVEFGMKNGMRSRDKQTDFFVCTKPRSTDFDRMIRIPEGKDFESVYFMMPVLVCCLLLSATFSGLNLAIMSFSITDLKLIQGSDTHKINRQRAGDVLRLRRHSNYVLVTIIFGNCFCNTSITILLNYFGDFYGFGDFGYVELTATALLLIFTEILPSLICTKNALYVASRMQYFVIFAMVVTMPISYPLSKLLDRILGKENADESTPIEIGTVQLEAMLDETMDDGLGMMNVVQKTLALRKKRAEDVMTPIARVGMISDTQAVTQDFLTAAYENGHSRLPVYENKNINKICGVLNITDVMLLMDDGGRGLDTDLTAGTLLSVLEKRRKHCFALNTLPVQQFMSELQRGCTMAIVVEYVGNDIDEDDLSDEDMETQESYKVIGIITLEDYMEEIIGEISDEKDKKDKKGIPQKIK
uniref:Metal transporter n=1 Tax=Caenorhabditis tropicalis TaxID=1561998 RepID=A0A1I7UJI4_9PELO